VEAIVTEFFSSPPATFGNALDESKRLADRRRSSHSRRRAGGHRRTSSRAGRASAGANANPTLADFPLSHFGRPERIRKQSRKSIGTGPMHATVAAKVTSAPEPCSLRRPFRCWRASSSGFPVGNSGTTSPSWTASEDFFGVAATARSRSSAATAGTWHPGFPSWSQPVGICPLTQRRRRKPDRER
jgi:hypothetical protein